MMKFGLIRMCILLNLIFLLLLRYWVGCRIMNSMLL